jgi:hypothetical protein
LLNRYLIPRQFKPGEVIVKAGDTARYLLTYHTDKAGNDSVIQFARDGWWCSDFFDSSDSGDWEIRT